MKFIQNMNITANIIKLYKIQFANSLLQIFASRDDKHNWGELFIQVIKGHFHHLQLNKE